MSERWYVVPAAFALRGEENSDMVGVPGRREPQRVTWLMPATARALESVSAASQLLESGLRRDLTGE